MKKAIFTICLLCLSTLIACKNLGTSLEKNDLKKTCVESLGTGLNKLPKENQFTIKQFLSKNKCSKEATTFAKRAVDALLKGDLKKVSLPCLNSYFEKNQNSPFNISFGGVFNCDAY